LAPIYYFFSHGGGNVRIFIRNHNTSPEQSVREAVSILSKADIYSTDGGTIGGRGAILVAAEYLGKAVTTLSKAGLWTDIG
jgi:hypothetical protein